MRLLAAALLALVVLGYGEAWVRWLDAVSAFRLHLGVIAVAVALIALLARRRLAAAVAAVAVGLSLVGLGPVWQAPTLDGPEDGASFTLLFANIRFRNPDLPAAAEALLAEEADVLVTVETPEEAFALLAPAYPYRAIRQRPGRVLRSVIWSRHPLEAPAVHLDETRGPVAAAAVVDLGEARVGLIGGHFMRAWLGLAEGQIDGLAGMAGTIDAPLVVAGDMNAVPWSRLVAEAANVTGTRVLGGYRVTWRGRYPGGLPEPWGHQIDHLLAAPGVGVDAVHTVAIPGSDHRGLLARITVPRAETVEETLSGVPGGRYLGAATE